MGGLFVAGAVVTLVQLLRLRDRRMAPLALLLAFLAGAASREPWEPAHARFQVAALVSGLALLAMLSLEARGRGGRP
jgi:hypothetical protein